MSFETRRETHDALSEQIEMYSRWGEKQVEKTSSPHFVPGTIMEIGETATRDITMDTQEIELVRHEAEHAGVQLPEGNVALQLYMQHFYSESITE